MSNNSRPIIVQYQQNDASVESENYLRNKRWIIGRANHLQQTIKEQYRQLESNQNQLSDQLMALKNELRELISK
jgi:hypothetical protein